MDELFTAYREGGAFLNGKRIYVRENTDLKNLWIQFNLSMYWQDPERGQRIYRELTRFKTYRALSSFAVNYCHVACGRYDGTLALTKDVFPEIAGSLIIREAGGVFINERGEEWIQPDDRIFVGGHPYAAQQLQTILKTA